MLIIFEETTYYPKSMLHRVENGRKCIFCEPCYASRMFKICGIECAVSNIRGLGKVEDQNIPKISRKS